MISINFTHSIDFRAASTFLLSGLGAAADGGGCRAGDGKTVGG